MDVYMLYAPWIDRDRFPPEGGTVTMVPAPWPGPDVGKQMRAYKTNPEKWVKKDAIRIGMIAVVEANDSEWALIMQDDMVLDANWLSIVERYQDEYQLINLAGQPWGKHTCPRAFVMHESIKEDLLVAWSDPTQQTCHTWRQLTLDVGVNAEPVCAQSYNGMRGRVWPIP